MTSLGRNLTLVLVWAICGWPGAANAQTAHGELVRAFRSYNDYDYEPAMLKMRDGGASTVPILIELLKDDDEAVRLRAAEVLGQIGPAAKTAGPTLISSMSDPDRSVAQASVTAVGCLGPDFIPDLIHAAHSEPLSKRAATALGKLGKAGIMALAKLLLDENEHTSYAALAALENAGLAAAPAVPSIVEKLRSQRGDPWVFGSLLGHIAERSDRTFVATLQPLLRDPREQVRVAAVRALGRMRAKAGSAAPMLAKALDDPNEEVRGNALRALSDVGGPPSLIVPRLILASRSRDWSVSTTAIEELGAFGSAALAPLTDLVDDPQVDEDHKWRAVESLQKVGPSARTVILRAFVSENRRVAEVATEALQAMPVDETSLLVVQKSLHNPQAHVRRNAVQILGNLKRPSVSVVRDLVQVLADPDRFVRRPAATALGRIGSAAALPALATLLADPDEEQRIWVSEAIARIRPTLAEIPALLNATSDRDEEVRGNVTWALTGLHPVDGAVVLLRDALETGSPEQKRCILWAMGNLGTKALVAAPAIARALRDHDAAVRANAVRALGFLGPAARTHSEDVRRALQDSDSEVRHYAEWALSRMETPRPPEGGRGTKHTDCGHIEGW